MSKKLPLRDLVKAKSEHKKEQTLFQTEEECWKFPKATINYLKSRTPKTSCWPERSQAEHGFLEGEGQQEHYPKEATWYLCAENDSVTCRTSPQLSAASNPGVDFEQAEVPLAAGSAVENCTVTLCD